MEDWEPKWREDLPDCGKTCFQIAFEILNSEFQKDSPSVARVSIALGLLETPLTSKDEKKRSWPDKFQESIDLHCEAFDRFIDGIDKAFRESNEVLDARKKVTVVANKVWAKLTGSFSKSTQHAQHVGCFTRFLGPNSVGNRRHLDCAGVVTVVFAICKKLAEHPSHANLNNIHMQVSEDHCWLTMGPEGSRLNSIEITTENAEARGKVVEEAAWKGWLYNGGHAPICNSKTALTAIVNSIDPAIVDRPVNGIDSEEMQDLQYNMLSFILEKHRDAMYPNALCSLADLKEVACQDAMDASYSTSNADSLKNLITETCPKIHALFQDAINLCVSSHFWYPYSYICNSQFHLAIFLAKKACKIMDGHFVETTAVQCLKNGCQLLKSGSAVLKQYRFSPLDDQLYKDIEGLLEECLKSCALVNKTVPLVDDSLYLTSMLEFWDGICCLFHGRSKPTKWINMIITFAKIFPPEIRKKSANEAQVTSSVVKNSIGLWTELRPNQIRQAFETIEVSETGRRPKRRRID